MDQELLIIALDNISLEYSNGNVSSDVLRKACERYKELTSFQDDFENDLKITKSCYDFIHNLTPDSEIEKGIIPGTTKVIGGITYIWANTKFGSQTKYAWHVANKNTPQQLIDRAKKDNTSVDGAAQLFEDEVNALFPTDVNNLKVVNNNPGGSTGAKIVEDVNGNRYVMKRGDNANDNNEHVGREYLSNQLYNLLGVNVPYYELYNDNKTNVLLSKFIPNCHQPNYNGASDLDALSKYFIHDALLANWDSFKNDNCLIDANGKVYHVDNGGCLDQRAQGLSGHKKFDDDVLATFKDLAHNNKPVYDRLDVKEIERQVNDIKGRKKQILDFIKNSKVTTGDAAFQKNLETTIGKRIDNLDAVVSYFKSQNPGSTVNGTNKILIHDTRTKKTQRVPKNGAMYATLSDQELDDVWSDMDSVGGTPINKAEATDKKNGWILLNKICNIRGFNAQPTVVSEKEYWNIVSKDPSKQFFRGLGYDGKMNTTAMAHSLMYEDECYYGAIGAYGEGLYAHRNADKHGVVSSKTNESNYTKSDAYSHAVSYATQGGKGVGCVVKGCLASDAKIIQFSDLLKMHKNLIVSTVNSDEITGIQDDIDKLLKDKLAIDDEMQNFSANTRVAVNKAMKYDQYGYMEMLDDIDNTDWDAVDANGEPDFPKYNDFVEKRMVDWVKKQGGDAVKEQGQMRFTLPNSNKECIITEYQYSGPNALKRKNIMSGSWNYAVNKFTDWVTSEHVNKVNDKINAELSSQSQQIVDFKNKMHQIDNEIAVNQQEIQKLNKVSENSVMGVISNHKTGSSSDELKGLLAAIKGYDAIEAQPSTGSNSFYIILNRSKMIVSNEVNKV